MFLRRQINYLFSSYRQQRSRLRKPSEPIQYCHKPILEVSNEIINHFLQGQYGVIPARFVPSHIVRPEYVDSAKPIFGIYEGEPVKHDTEFIQKMRRAANLAAKTVRLAQESVKAGMTTEDIDQIVHDFIIKHDAYPTPIGFMGFPKSVCTSVNEVCCHGIPNLRPLEEGDYLNIDVTLFLDGVHGDTSMMAKVGNVHPKVNKLIDATQKAVYESIKVCKPGVRFRQIGEVCEQIADENGFVVCELFNGHGVGKLLHMPPTIMHHYNDYPGVMEPGNVFTIEPIFLMKHGEYVMWNDNFTVLSPDNPSGKPLNYISPISIIAQWEHTILITETGCEVLTKRDNETIIY